MALDLSPKRHGLASSLQAFFAGLSNVINVGVIALTAMGSVEVEGSAAASAMLGITGLVSWKLYRFAVVFVAGAGINLETRPLPG